MVNQEIKLRQMQIRDLKDLMEIKNDEHWNQTERDWNFLVENYAQHCLVATSDDIVVGTVTSTNFNKQVGWIGMMLVRKLFRGQGVSKRLMNAVIESLGDCESIKLDATPAGTKVYEKLNFKEEYEVFRITNREQKHISGKPLTYSVHPISKEILKVIKEKDRLVFGCDRSKLFDYLLTQETECHIYSGTRDDLKGYAFSRLGTNFTQIGPVVADSLETAKNLIGWAFTKVQGPVVIDILADKPELIHWLAQNGFEIQRKFIRMYLGSNPYPGDTSQYFAIAGPEYG